MNGGFRVVVGSPREYEELVAEIYIGDEFVGLLSQEEGLDSTVFEIAPRNLVLKVPLAIFEEALAHAKRRLWDLRKRRGSADQDTGE